MPAKPPQKVESCIEQGIFVVTVDCARVLLGPTCTNRSSRPTSPPTLRKP